MNGPVRLLPCRLPAPTRWPPLLAVLAIAVLAFCIRSGMEVRAAEFATPPGINVPAQEKLLEERVTQLARDIVGDKLVSVEVHIGYLRTGTGPEGKGRVKLPGLNNYISNGVQQGAEIVPAFTRVRQIFVMIDDTFGTDPAQVERELRVAGQFDPAAGDWVKVLAVPAPGTEEGAEAKEDADKGDMPRARRKPPRRAPEAAGPVDPIAEAESTKSLIRARQAYFNGNYDRALDEILQSLYSNPDNPQAYAMLGSLYYTMNWDNLAVQYWERSLELDPDNTQVRELLQRVRPRQAAQ